MAEFTVPEHVYMEGLLSDYADAIPANETVLATNALWIRDALIGLVWGIVGIATGFLLLVVPLPATHVASFGITILAGLVLLTYAIVDETYMARDAQLET